MTFRYMPLNLTLDDLEHQGQGYQKFKSKYLKNQWIDFDQI